MLGMSPNHRLTNWLAVLGLGLTACVQQPAVVPRPNDVPGGRSISESPTLHDRYFPITSGAHDGAECNTCHGDFDTFAEFSCFGCHDHDRGVTDPKHTAVAEYAYESARCYDCHPRGTAEGIDPAAHAQYFPIEAGSSHGSITCSTCHVDPNDRRKVECINCHDHDAPSMGARHQGIPGYQWVSGACLTCHPRSQINFDRASHDPYFPIAAGTRHEALDCSTCHTTPDDRTKVECIRCHDHAEAPMQAVHGRLPGYAWSDAACLGCHPRGEVQFDRADHEVFFPIAAGAPHEAVDCAGCHTVPGDRSHVECISCHEHAAAETNAIHGGLPDYAYEDAACKRCHPKGEVDFDRTTHEQYFPIAAGSAHGAQTCSACHPEATNRQVVDCITCHAHERTQTQAAHTSVGNYNYTTALCMRCHYDSSVLPVAQHPTRPVRATHGGRPSRCLECHDRVQPAKTWAADFTQQNCSHNTAGCHED